MHNTTRVDPFAMEARADNWFQGCRNGQKSAANEWISEQDTNACLHKMRYRCFRSLFEQGANPIGEKKPFK